MPHRIQSYLSESEINDILRQPNRMSLLGKRDYAILLLMISTGIRLSEVCSLRRGDLKQEGKKIWLYVIGKGDRQRKIPIKSHDLISALTQYWKKAKTPNDPDQPFFGTLGWRGPDKGGPLQQRSIKHLVPKYAALAKIDKHIHPHSLRHTFITHALRKSGDLSAVQALAGHSSITSTQVYLHTEDDRMEAAIKKMEEAS